MASPFIKLPVAQRVITVLGSEGRELGGVHLRLATDLRPNSYLQGAADIEAILLLAEAFTRFSVTHVPGLHAKLYVADEDKAVITSANLTEGGLSGNMEYGVLLQDERLVSQVRRDLDAYLMLGARLPVDTVRDLGERLRELQVMHNRAQARLVSRAREAFARALERVEVQMMEHRARGQTTNAIFARTIQYLLTRGPMRTVELHQHIKRIHPDLCDDSIDRVIHGVHFGKKWKHYVRNAQQYLKRKGIIRLEGGRWRLCQPGASA